MKQKIKADFFKEYVNITDMKPNGAGLFSFVRYDTDMENDKYISPMNGSTRRTSASSAAVTKKTKKPWKEASLFVYSTGLT